MEYITYIESNSISSVKLISSELFDDFIKFLRIAPKSVETYKRALKQFNNFLQAHNIEKPTKEDIYTYLDELTESGKKPTTVRAYLMAVKRFFQWTEEKGAYADVAKNIKAPALSDGHRKDPLSSKQIKKVLEVTKGSTIKSIRDYAIIALVFCGGLREIELVRANIGDLRPLNDGIVLYIQGKGRLEKTEYINIVDEVDEVLRAYFALRGCKDEDEPLFTSLSNNSNGQRMTTRSIRRIITEAYIKAGIKSPRITPHSARHSAITLALEKGETLEEVQNFARHKNMNTTLIYSHHVQRAKSTVERTIADAIFK